MCETEGITNSASVQWISQELESFCSELMRWVITLKPFFLREDPFHDVK